MAARVRRKGSIVKKAKKVPVVSCRDLKAAIGRELTRSVKDRALARRLINSLGMEVAYGTGGGGGVGVA